MTGVNREGSGISKRGQAKGYGGRIPLKLCTIFNVFLHKTENLMTKEAEPGQNLVQPHIQQNSSEDSMGGFEPHNPPPPLGTPPCPRPIG